VPDSAEIAHRPCFDGRMSDECFRLIEPCLMAEAAPAWAPHFRQFDTVVGYSDLVDIATPYPFVGGTEAPETYDIGDVWVFLDIVAQFQGNTPG
jgi:hypothetical protein